MSTPLPFVWSRAENKHQDYVILFELGMLYIVLLLPLLEVLRWYASAISTDVVCDSVEPVHELWRKMAFAKTDRLHLFETTNHNQWSEKAVVYSWQLTEVIGFVKRNFIWYVRIWHSFFWDILKLTAYKRVIKFNVKLDTDFVQKWLQKKLYFVIICCIIKEKKRVSWIQNKYQIYFNYITFCLFFSGRIV